MNPKTDCGTAPPFADLDDPAVEQELFLSSSRSQTEGGAPILLQLLEFKTHLQEVVEELHIRRDAETRFEDEISKLVLEKQELEWEKESLQHQIETMTKQHTESLGSVKKTFQVKLQHTEEEKGKYQVSAELKDKEINNLKEELKSLQLLKYNLEKKSSELEQKLALQSRTKDNHLKQLAEVEKRFSALSKQCAMVKQAHDKLEQNVDEAMKINNKLTSACQKQEEMVVSLKKELEEVRNKLIKEKMKSVRHEKTQSPLGREQHVQELQQKLNAETEINKKLREEYVAERAEKQRFMRSLQHNQQLLLSQTQTVRRIEQQLESQTMVFQALKEEHEVMRENRKAIQDKVAELTESHAASKASWDKERATFLNQIQSEQSDLQDVKEAYKDLQQKCSELTLQANSEPQRTEKPEMKDNGQSPFVPTRLYSSVSDGVAAEETPNDPNSSSGLSDLDFLPLTVSSQDKIPDCLKDTGAASKLAATGASGDQDNSHHQQNIIKNSSNLTSSVPDNSEKATESSDMSDLIGLGESYLSNSTCLSTPIPGCGSLNGSTEILDSETYEEKNVGKNEKEQGGEDSKQETSNTDQERKKVFQADDVKSGSNAGEKVTSPVQTADRAEIHRGPEGSAKAAERISDPEAETRDRGEGEVTDGVKERGQTAERESGTPETQIPALTAADTTEARLTEQVNDFMVTEPPTAVCEPLNSTRSVPQKVTAEDVNLNDDFSVNTKDEQPSVSAEDALHNNQSTPLCPIPGGENPSRETSGAFPAEYVQELQTETKRCNPSRADVAQTDENTDAPASKEPELTREPPQEISAKQSVPLTSAVANGEEEAQTRKESQLNVNTRETSHILSSASSLKDASVEAILLPGVSTGNILGSTETNVLKDVRDTEIAGNRGDLKLSVQPSRGNNESSQTECLQLFPKAPKEKRAEASFDLSLMSRKTSRPLFDWGSAQRGPFSSRLKSDGSVLHRLTQGTNMSGLDTGGHPQSTTHTLSESRQNKGDG
ncbi:coiled-coil domain-containing protein 73 [Fundulus heteroclitus]|uniref:coiled-coil domain-containing protein 73 n=1 Tax=Fundulus heteroclitus TaxID=8078 RepID=UPI00165A986D|nr:coiled-coil domain-containing protein 73 [Fundulus heteroclitus]